MQRFLGVAAALLCVGPAFAGPLSPCIRAALSASGNFLVITEAKFAHPLPAIPESVTLRVISKETSAVDTNHKVSSPNTYWIGEGWNGWHVRIERGDSFMSGCPISIISDDGEFMILLQSNTFDSAMRVYRRGKQDHEGVIVKDITLKDIWPENRWQEWRNALMTDETPEWFAGGSFTFSSDSRTLIHKTRWGNTVRIDLADGSVSR